MKASLAKKILGCSYTTLHNYVKSGKLKTADNPLSQKQTEYDEISVYQLHKQLFGHEYSSEALQSNRVSIYVNADGSRHEFFPDDVTTQQILAFLQEKQNAMINI